MPGGERCASRPSKFSASTLHLRAILREGIRGAFQGHAEKGKNAGYMLAYFNQENPDQYGNYNAYRSL